MPTTGIATFLSGSVNNALSTFVTKSSVAVSMGIAPLVVIGVTIWATTYGMAVMRNEVADPVMGFLKNLTKMSIILTMALTSGIYQSQIVEGVGAFQGWFVSIVSASASGTTPATASGDIFVLIDAFDAKVTKLSFQILGHGLTLLPWGGWLDLIAGIITMLVTALMIVVILGFSLMAQVAISFMLGLGPMFLASLAFPPTAKFFDAWLGKIMNYTFLIIGLAVAISITLVIVGAYVSHFDASQTATNAIADAFGLVIVEGALGILIWQMPTIASGLGGGSALSGGGVGAFVGGLMAGRVGGAIPKPDSSEKGKGGGSIKNGGGGGGKGGGKGGRGREVPAYRRATLDRLQSRGK